MKFKIYFITLLSIASLVLSCESDDSLNYQNDFENSQEAWLNFKESSNNSYKYVIPGGTLSSPSWETTITVSNGVIIERDFKYTTGDLSLIPEDQLEWTENESEINSSEHEDTAAYYALTLDDIYDKAEQEWLIKRKDATTYFESNNNGLISSCGYVMNGCADSCFTGIGIKSIETL